MAITGHAASVTLRPISSRACSEVSPTITIAASGRMEAVVVLHHLGSSAHDLVPEAHHGVRDLFESMPLPIRDQDPEPLEVALVLLGSHSQPRPA
jgi:hypothetical protein